jgi:hypothetical protein
MVPYALNELGVVWSRPQMPTRSGARSRRETTNTSHERSEATMADTHEPGPETDEEDEDKVLDDLDPDEAEAAGIKGGSDDDYDQRVILR